MIKSKNKNMLVALAKKEEARYIEVPLWHDMVEENEVYLLESQDYLVRTHRLPHNSAIRAHWDNDLKCFFPLDTSAIFPLMVDVFMKIPDYSQA